MATDTIGGDDDSSDMGVRFTHMARGRRDRGRDVDHNIIDGIVNDIAGQVIVGRAGLNGLGFDCGCGAGNGEKDDGGHQHQNSDQKSGRSSDFHPHGSSPFGWG